MLNARGSPGRIRRNFRWNPSPESPWTRPAAADPLRSREADPAAEVRQVS